LLCKNIIVAKSKEVKTGCNLAGSSKEGYGSKRAVLPTMMMMMTTPVTIQSVQQELHLRPTTLWENTAPEIPLEVINHDDGNSKFSRNLGKPLTFDEAQTRKSNLHPLILLLLGIIRREGKRLRILLFRLVARLPAHKPMCENIKNRVG
jgi:hypothetical protein